MVPSKRAAWLIGVILGGSFALGFCAPALRAQGGLPTIAGSFSTKHGPSGIDPASAFLTTFEALRTSFYADRADDRLLAFAAIRGLLRTVDDPYTRFLDPRAFDDLRQENEGAFEDIGLEIENKPVSAATVRIRKPHPGSPSDAAGIREGDVLSRIDGKSLSGMTVMQVVRTLRGKSGSIVRLRIMKENGRTREVSVRRAPVEYEVVSSAMKDGGVGYVYLSEFNDRADTRLVRAIRDLQRQGMRALVLDLRGNPGGMFDAAIDISSRFLPGGKNIVTVRGAGGAKEVRLSDPAKQLIGKIPVAVLVNRMSASASEIVAGAIKDNGAGTLIGTPTFGKGLIQTVIPLPGNCGMLVTSGKYVTPSGADINREPGKRGGVTPDLTVEITAEQFSRGEDTQLEEALRFLHTRIGPGKGRTARGSG